MNNVQFVRKSSNAKTGPIPTTTSPRATCPTECPLAGDGGCYAEAGYYTRLNWNKVDSGERGMSWSDFLSAVRKLPAGQLWRHNVAGDLPQDANGRIDRDAVRGLVAANVDRRGFTYTHYDPRDAHNLDVIESCNRAGFTVNISANNVGEARALRERTSAPVVTIVSVDAGEDWRRMGDVVRCPAEYRDDVSCATCQLCQRADRKDIVGFTVHGTRSKAANIIASA